ncbi:MAG: SWIM zinc finger family protein, partial [Puniceicoccales bacterium]|nr:SWIM zinc finger family protein [Puniceicoccales bacterium]
MVAAIVHGKTWWGKKWLDAFIGIDEENRLSRGKSYATNGLVVKLKVEKNLIEAQVQGTHWLPYSVRISLPLFTKEQQEEIVSVVEGSPAILAALVNKRLPQQLFDKLMERNIALFPSSWATLGEADCTCPDWAVPCKHLAAVIYVMASEIDKNPFLIFSLHGCDLLHLVGDFSDGKLESAQRVPTLENLLAAADETQSVFDDNVLESINLANISDLSERVNLMLADNPPFSLTNFHRVFREICGRWKRHACSNFDAFTATSFQYMGVDVAERDDDEIAVRLCAPFARFSNFSISLDANGKLCDAYGDGGKLNLMAGKAEPSPAERKRGRRSTAAGKSQDNGTDEVLLALLVNILPPKQLHRLCPEVRFLHYMLKLTRKLIENGAIIPQLVANGEGELLIRWTPAIFDDEVRKVVHAFTSTCPKNLVLFNGGYVSSTEAVNAIVNSFVLAHSTICFPLGIPGNNAEDELQLMFFCGKPITDSNGRGHAIGNWLLPLSLHKKKHHVHLLVDEEDEDDEEDDANFSLSILVSLPQFLAPIPFREALAHEQDKISLLGTASLIVDHIPEMSAVLDGDPKAIIPIHKFTRLFSNILPLLRAMGIQVILPKALAKIFRPRPSLSIDAEKPVEFRQSFFGLNNLLHFDWKVAIGDQRIGVEEFRALTEKCSGLVKIRGNYVMLDGDEMQSLLQRLEKVPEKMGPVELFQTALAEEGDGGDVK